jgi:hypothetical protein
MRKWEGIMSSNKTRMPPNVQTGISDKGNPLSIICTSSISLAIRLPVAYAYKPKRVLLGSGIRLR